MVLAKRLSELSYEELMGVMADALKTPEAADGLLKAMEKEPGLLERFEGVQWLDLSQMYGDLIHRRDQPF